MPRARLIGWVAAIAATAAIAHLVWSLSIAFAMEQTYDHRVVDLRRWLGRQRGVAAQRELMARFIDLEVRRATRPTLAFFGSSFTFGYPWQEPVILSRRYRELRPDQAVINASVTGGDLSLVHDWGICGALRQQVMLDAALIEIPVINTLAHLSQIADAGPRALDACDGAPFEPRGYWPFVIKQPLGLGWMRFLWDVEAYEKPDESIVIVKVPPGYFVTRADFNKVRRGYAAMIAQTLAGAKRVAKRVYAFPSPVYLPALDEIGEDEPAVREQLDATLDACRAVDGIVCLDPGPFYTRREAFYNMTHLNQRGHQEIAEWLAREIPR